MLLWYVQNLVMIQLSGIESVQNEISDLNYEHKIISEKHPKRKILMKDKLSHSENLSFQHFTGILGLIIETWTKYLKSEKQHFQLYPMT